MVMEATVLPGRFLGLRDQPVEARLTLALRFRLRRRRRRSQRAHQRIVSLVHLSEIVTRIETMHAVEAHRVAPLRRQ